MSNYIEVIAAQTTGLVQFNGGGTQYLVQKSDGTLVLFYVDTGSDVAVRYSTNRGLTWSTPTIVFAGTVTALSVWYDRWSGISADLVHVAYTESATDDTLYKYVDIADPSLFVLSTQTTIFAGTSTATGGNLSITRARGGNLYCHTMIDAGAEGGFYRSTDVGATWGARTVSEAIATTDQIILLPGWAADNQDIMAFFWDASANEISRKLHDDSANTWSETSIAASMVDQAATTAFPHFAAAVDITNSRNLLVAWSAVDTLNADLRCWHVTESAITEVTNVVLNSTDDQGLCAIGIDVNTNYWYVFYGGKSDGSETFLTSINIYYKFSTDSGSTWSNELQLTGAAKDITWLICVPRFYSYFTLAYHNDIALDEIMIIATANRPAGKIIVS